jgi:hypothetical protein
MPIHFTSILKKKKPKAFPLFLSVDFLFFLFTDYTKLFYFSSINYFGYKIYGKAGNNSKNWG